MYKFSEKGKSSRRFGIRQIVEFVKKDVSGTITNHGLNITFSDVDVSFSRVNCLSFVRFKICDEESFHNFMNVKEKEYAKERNRMAGAWYSKQIFFQQQGEKCIKNKFSDLDFDEIGEEIKKLSWTKESTCCRFEDTPTSGKICCGRVKRNTFRIKLYLEFQENGNVIHHMEIVIPTKGKFCSDVECAMMNDGM
jgi:hypothetical protein